MSPTYDPSNKIRCNFKEILNNVISHILLSPVVWKVKMAEDDIAFLLNRGELVELVYKTSIIFINTDYHIVRACELQYDTPRGTIFTNIHAIALLLYSNKYFFFRTVINIFKI
jgi:hypothetical protein